MTTQMLYPARDVAQALGRSRSWLVREVAAGRFPDPLRMGGQLVWTHEDLESYAASLERVTARERRRERRASEPVAPFAKPPNIVPPPERKPQ